MKTKYRLKKHVASLCAGTLFTMGTAQGVVVFFDDFEDETGSAPAINTSSTGAGDTADVGTSWTQGNSYIVNVSGDKYLETRSTPAIAAFSDSIFTNGATVSFNFGLEYTNAGNTYGIFTLQNTSGDTLIELRFYRGTNKRISNVSDSITTLAVDLANGSNNAVSYHSITLNLAASNFSMTVDGGTPVTSLEYFNSTNEPGTLARIALGDSIDTTTRLWRIDDLKVQGTAVPEPSATALLGIAGAALLIRRRR